MSDNLLERVADDTTQVLDEQWRFFNTVLADPPSRSAISEGSGHPAPSTVITEQARCTPCRPCRLLMMGEKLIVKQTEAEALWTAAGPSDAIRMHGIQIFLKNPMLCKWRNDHPVNVVTMTTSYLWPLQLEVRDRCVEWAAGHHLGHVLQRVLCCSGQAALTPFTSFQKSAPLANTVPCLFWSLMDFFNLLFCFVFFEQVFHLG